MTWLSDKEVAEYTRRVKPSAQRKVLDRAGIPYKWVDGRPVVLRSDIGHSDRSRKAVRLNFA